MGTQAYLPRGGACVSCRRRKMVGIIALCISSLHLIVPL